MSRLFLLYMYIDIYICARVQMFEPTFQMQSIHTDGQHDELDIT